MACLRKINIIFNAQSSWPYLPGHSHDDSYMSPRATHPDNTRSVTRNQRNLPVAAPIRSGYICCNIMYTVATHLVEVKSKQSFSESLTDASSNPLLCNRPVCSLKAPKQGDSETASRLDTTGTRIVQHTRNFLIGLSRKPRRRIDHNQRK